MRPDPGTVVAAVYGAGFAFILFGALLIGAGLICLATVYAVLAPD